MNKLKKVSIAAALLASAGTMSMAAMAGPGQNHNGYKGHNKNHLYQKLNITEEQKAQIRAGKQQRQAQMKQTKKELRAVKKEINQLMLADVLDRNQLRNLLQKQADLKLEKMTQKHAASQEFNALLTEEQRVKLDKIKANMKERRAMKREKREQRRNAHIQKAT